MTLPTFYEETLAYLKSHYEPPVDIVVILGSGLGILAETDIPLTAIPYTDVPRFPPISVKGHAGKLHLGKLPSGKSVAFMEGRYHFYEGYSMAEVIYPLRILHLLGAKTLVVTNASGAINQAFEPGDLMLIADHLNLMGTNPLIGSNLEALGERFPDMTQAYSPELTKIALTAAKQLKINLKQGIYAALPGPSYETPSEIRMLRTLGADCVGMSTVPEVIAARHMQMQVMGLSCIANQAAGVCAEKPLHHEDVLAMVAQVQHVFSRLLKQILLAL